MTFDDIKDQLQNLGTRVLENPQIQNLKERYEALHPRMQSLVQVAASALTVFALLLLPMSWHSESNESVIEFEAKRNLIRDLLKVSREAQEVPNIPVPPNTDSLKSMIETQLNNAGILAEQIKGIDITSGASVIFPEALTAGGLDIRLWKLNLRQVIDIGHQIQAMNASVKLRDLILTANTEDSRYFDVTFKTSSLKVPDLTAPPPVIEEDTPKNKKSSRASKKKLSPSEGE